MTKGQPRIAILTPYSSSDYLGGVEVFNSQLQQVLECVQIFTDPRKPRISPRWNLDRIGMGQPQRALRVTRSFLKEHQTRPFQLIICNGICGWPLAIRDINMPMVQVYHFTMAGLARQALSLPGDRLTTGRISGFFDGLAGRRKHVVAVSTPVLREVERYYGLRGRVIPNTVDTETFKKMDKSSARKRLGLPEDATIGLFVGRAEYAKGFDILLEVARSMRETLFVLVGNCPRIEPNIRVFENVSHSKMPLYCSSADFFFLPSRYEGFSLAMLEALACDLPVVVSEAAYTLVEDPSSFGYVAESLNPSEFVQGIREVLHPRSSYASRETIVTKYSFEVFRDNWSGLVNMLLERGTT